MSKLTINSEFTYKFAATQGKQYKPFHQLSLPISVLVRMLNIDDAGSTMDRSQRSINEKRAEDFAHYILSNLVKDTFWICPTVSGVIVNPDEDAMPVFVSVAEMTEQNVEHLLSIGTLVVAMDSRILLFDGQHRSRGLAIALQLLAEDKKLPKEKQKYASIDLKQAKIPMLIFAELTLEERQLGFADMNGNMSKPPASISIAYNHRDPLARFAVELAEELTCFKSLVDFERNTIAKGSDFLFPLKTIQDCIKLMLGLGKNYTDESFSDENKEFVRSAFVEFSRAMGWGALSFTETNAASYRDEFITTHTVMMKAMSVTANVIREKGQDIRDVNLKGLGDIDFGRDSDEFKGRCIDSVTGNMIMNQTGVTLASHKLLMGIGFPLNPVQLQTERQYFGDQAA